MMWLTITPTRLITPNVRIAWTHMDFGFQTARAIIEPRAANPVLMSSRHNSYAVLL